LNCMPDLAGLYLARIASADCFSLSGLILKCDLLVSSLCFFKWVNLYRYAKDKIESFVQGAGFSADVYLEEADQAGLYTFECS
jgi:hypothetical protein